VGETAIESRPADAQEPGSHGAIAARAFEGIEKSRSLVRQRVSFEGIRAEKISGGKSSGWITAPAQWINVNSTALRSSRTFPGHS
jgi:hypothetical protein